MKSRTACISTILALVLCSTSAIAETEADVREWIKSQCRNASSMGSMPLHIKWKEVKLYVPTPETMARLSDEVLNKPEHPLQSVIVSWIQHSRGKIDEKHVELWINGKDVYRNHTRWQDGPEIDTARSPGDAWNWPGTSFSIYDPAKFPPGADPVSASSTFRMSVVDMLWPGMFPIMQTKAEERLSIKPSERPSGWTVSWQFVENVSTPAAQVEIDWDTTRKCGIVRSHRAIGTMDMTDPSRWSIPTSFRFSELEYSELLHSYVAKRIETFNERNERVGTITLVAHDASSKDEVLRMTKTPSENSPDPLRGWSKSVNISDFREGWYMDGHAGLYAGQSPGATNTPKKGMSSVSVWAIVTSVVGAVVVLFYRKVKATAR